MSLDWAAFERAGIEAMVAAATRGAQLIASKAKEKAPVRKVFRGQEGRIGMKSVESITADRDLRRQLGLGPENTHIQPPLTVLRDAPRRLAARRVISPGQLASIAAQQNLSRRGRYELRSGRGVHGNQLGGRLRDEIHAEEARIDGDKIVARAVSPTPYADKQEFGTRHNAAHPYMRPAAHESEGEIKADIGRSVAQATRSALRGVTETITIRTKVTKR